MLAFSYHHFRLEVGHILFTKPILEYDEYRVLVDKKIERLIVIGVLRLSASREK